MIPLSDEDIRARFSNARPGRVLIAIEHAALPVTAMRVLVSAQEEKPLPLLEEFTLRSVQAGLGNLTAIAPILGLERESLADAAASLVVSGNLAYSEDTGNIDLTSRGRLTAAEMVGIAPVELEIPACFDRAIWRVAEYVERDLISRHDAIERGMLLLPALRTQHVERRDLRLVDLEHLVGTGRARSRRMQLLSVIRTRATKHRYLPIRLLVYADEVSARPELLALVEGEESFSHNDRLDEAGGATAFNMSLRRDAPAGRRAVGSQKVSPPAEFTTAIGALDHPLHLADALLKAERRIVLSTGSVRRSIVGKQFTTLLEQRLRDDVLVHVALDTSDPAFVDRPAWDELTALAKRFANLRVVEERNAPRALVYDDTTICSSFDWLGYRGGRERTYFAGEGELTRDSEFSEHISESIMEYSSSDHEGECS